MIPEAHRDRFHSPGEQEGREQGRHVVRVRGPYGDPPHPQFLRRVHEREGGRRRGQARRPGEGADLALGALPAVDEAAAGAGPDDGLGAGHAELFDACRQPLGGAHLQERVDAVRVLADVRVDHVEADVAAEELFHARVVVLGGVARVEESECGHDQPSWCSSGSTGPRRRADSSSSA
jgi:hypothetical protein